MLYVACMGLPCMQTADRLHYGAPETPLPPTWYLNNARIRSWDHFPVVVKVEGKEM